MSSLSRVIAAAVVGTVLSCPMVALSAISTVPIVAADTIDGSFDGVGRLSAGDTFDLVVVGRGGVPATGVDSVALNVTVTRPSATAFVTVWPTGSARPNASNLNVVRGQTVPNMVVVPVGVGGSVSLYTNGGATDLVVDVLGWFAAGGGFVGLTPARVLDTRVDGQTIDGSFAGGGALAAGATFDLQVSGRAGVPLSGVGAVALNVTVTNPTAAVFVTAWPTGSARPNASNLNAVAGQTVPNMVMVPLGASGRVSLFVNAGSADMIVDVLGWFPTGVAFHGLTPARVLDTRADGETVDGAFRSTDALMGGATFDLSLAGRGGVPVSGVGAVALNVTVTNPTASAFVTVWPAGSVRPNASNVNVVRGGTVPNMVMVPVSTDGRVSLFVNAGSADVIVDVLGWFPTDGAFVGLTPARIADTRGETGYIPVFVDVAPRSMVFDGANLWVSDRVNGLMRFAIGSEVAEHVSLPGFDFAEDLMFDGRFIWLTRLDEVGRYDTTTGAFTAFGPTWGASGPTTPVLLGSYVWTMNRGSNSLSRIDRLTGSMRVYPLPDGVAGASGLTTDGRYLWFPSFSDNVFVRFDPASRAIALVPLSTDLQGPLFAVFDGRRVWTSRHVFDGSTPQVAVTWVDVAAGTTGAVRLAAELGPVTDLKFDGTSLWASHAAIDRLSRIDPATGAVTVHAIVRDATDSFGVPSVAVGALVSDGRRLWVASHGGLSFVPLR